MSEQAPEKFTHGYPSFANPDEFVSPDTMEDNVTYHGWYFFEDEMYRGTFKRSGQSPQHLTGYAMYKGTPQKMNGSITHESTVPESVIPAHREIMFDGNQIVRFIPIDFLKAKANIESRRGEIPEEFEEDEDVYVQKIGRRDSKPVSAKLYANIFIGEQAAWQTERGLKNSGTVIDYEIESDECMRIFTVSGGIYELITPEEYVRRHTVTLTDVVKARMRIPLP